MSAQYFYIFVSKIPVWVFPLFAVLLFIGLQARKDRLVPIKLYWFLPLIGLTAVPGLIALGRSEAIAVFALTYSIGALFGSSFQQKIIQGFEGAKVRVRGEWLTLTTMMVLFSANFIKGATVGMAPDLANSLLFILPLVSITAFCSGTFLGRSLGVIKLSRAASSRLMAI